MITWEDVMKIIVSLGGASVIAWFAINFLANILSKKLEAKIQSRYDQKLADIEAKNSKDLEELKSVFVNKNYVSKVKFDKEFKIYGQLSKKFSDMIDGVLSTKPILDYLPEEKAEEKELFSRRRSEAASKISSAREVLMSNALFVPENIYDEFDNIFELCRKHFIDFDNWFEGKYVLDFREKEIGFDRRKYRERSEEIQAKRKEINNKLREYLEKLEVIQVEKTDE